jgi:hypothetical protein
MGFQLASFPNSRIKPRPATSQATTIQVTIPSGGLTATLVAAADPNRTYANLRNFSGADMYYGYANTINASTGMLLKGLESEDDIAAPKNIYVWQNSGAPITVGLDIGQG